MALQMGNSQASLNENINHMRIDSYHMNLVYKIDLKYSSRFNLHKEQRAI